MSEQVQVQMIEHNLNGNCWDSQVAFLGDGNLNDVCNAHDMPRGECDECPDCSGCVALAEAAGR